MLLEEKTGLGINLGVSECELLLPWEIIEWFVNVLDETPNLVQTTPEKFLPVKGFPEIIFKALQEKLEPAVGLFDEIWICAVEYNEDETSHLICLMGVQNSAQQAIVKSINEVLSFTDINKIFPIPITPARIVAIPTTNDKKDKPSTKLAVSLKTLPKLKPPIASSSLGFIYGNY